MDQSFICQKGLLTSEDVAKSPPGTNLPMVVKYSPDGRLKAFFLFVFHYRANVYYRWRISSLFLIDCQIKQARVKTILYQPNT